MASINNLIAPVEQVEAPVGTRLLALLDEDCRGKVEEVKILEYSPSDKWVKLQNGHGAKFWRVRSDVRVLEVLKALGKPSR